MLIEVCKAQKALHILNTDRELSIDNNCDFSKIHSNLFFDNNKTEVLDFFHIESTFINIKLKVSSLQLSENCLYMSLIFFLTLTVDQNIINVNSDKDIQIVS